MDDRTIARIIEILETDPDFFVPVKRLWLTLQDELTSDITPERLYDLFQTDERFQFIEDADHPEEFKDGPELGQEMESLDFTRGPRVKLASREMTAEDVFAAMAHSLETMNEALQGAWDTRPEGDQEIKDQLLDILASGQKLEREIHELIEQQRSEKDEK